MKQMQPDIDKRVCIKCMGIYHPWSMGSDTEPRQPAPSEYTCLTCRTKESK